MYGRGYEWHTKVNTIRNEMMNQLEQLGYERVTIRDNKQLLDNFRTILNERHAVRINKAIP